MKNDKQRRGGCLYKRDKRHFQLLELMVAAFILLICIAPVMRIFTSIYQSQQSIIRENQRDHLAHHVHAEVVERLYKREISIDDIENQLIFLSDPELNEQLKALSYSLEGILTIVQTYKPKGEEYPTMYLGKLLVKIKDILPKSQGAETFYDSYIYIDAGEMGKTSPPSAHSNKGKKG